MENSIAKNAVFNMMYKALSVLFPLVIVSYASRKLGASGIGEVSSAQNLVTYFTMFAALGIPSYGVRVIAQTRKDKGKCNKIFTELFVINMCSTCICFILYFILLQIIHVKVTSLNYVFSLLIILNFFNVEWVYEGFEKYQYIAIRSFIVKGISLILLLIFVKNQSDLIAYTFIVCFGTAGNYILNIVSLSKYVKFKFDSLEVIKHLKIIITFLGSIIAIELYSLIDVTMLTYATSSNVVGYYSNASKIVKMLANTITGIGAVMLPRLSLYFIEKKYDDVKNVIKNFLNAILTLSIPAAIGISFVSREIVILLFGVEFMPAVSTIVILSPLVVLMPLSGGVFGQLLLTSNNEKKYLLCVGLGAGINSILNFFFIHFWQHNGAAFASVITEAVVNILMVIFSFKIIKMGIDNKEIVKTFTASIIMMFLLIVLNRFCNNISIVSSVLVKVLLAMGIYFLTLYFMKQQFINNIIHSIISKLEKRR